MILYDSPNPAPNPRRVRIYLAEKGLRVPIAQVSIRTGEHRGDSYLAVNPLGQTPSLALDDRAVLTESVAICRYFEALHPEPPLFGVGAENTAQVDMWTRRVELRLAVAVGNVWTHTHPWTARLVPQQHRAFGEDQRGRAIAVMREFDHALERREWLDGERYTIADIVLLTTLDFAAFAGVAMPDDCPALAAWHARATARPSAQA